MKPLIAFDPMMLRGPNARRDFHVDPSDGIG